MSFDYSPPRWWVPVAITVALLALALAVLLVTLLGAVAWHLLQPLLDFAVKAAPVHVADAVGPFR
jgi:hypothetical protein